MCKELSEGENRQRSTQRLPLSAAPVTAAPIPTKSTPIINGAAGNTVQAIIEPTTTIVMRSFILNEWVVIF